MYDADRGLYCYIIIPFNLKNVRAIYQHLINGMFSKHVDKIWMYTLMICWSRVQS